MIYRGPRRANPCLVVNASFVLAAVSIRVCLFLLDPKERMGAAVR